MKIAGIIAEYNPFHEGHLYHLQRTRALTGCDFVVCVMSGAFTQRGECAILDKFARAECALRAGVDAVFELPVNFAVRPAQMFARGGVKILSALGVDALSFGCETDDLALLSRLTDALMDEPPALSSAIRAGLNMGKTLARARGEALAAYMGADANLLAQPNCTLALEYLKALRMYAPRVMPVAVSRATPYHSTELAPQASAAAIRAAIYAGNAREALMCLPQGARGIVSRALEGGVSRPAELDNLALYILRAIPPDGAEALPDAPEGLGARILKAARACENLEALVTSVKCKRYTRARITRAIAGAVLGLPACAPEDAQYLRLLGFRKASISLLGELAARSGGRVISDAALLEPYGDFSLECRATDIWGLTTQSPELRRCGRDRTQKFLVI